MSSLLTLQNNNRVFAQLGRLFFTPFALLIIILIGIVVRVDQYNLWSYLDRGYLHNEIPLVTNVDSYFYLSLARDIKNNNYTPTDTLRVYPDSPLRPTPPPLLSLLAAKISDLLKLSLEQLAAFLPVFLGVLIVIPVYISFTQLFNRVTGLSAALFCVISPYYLYRSGLGWFDTDSLNVTFSIAFPAIALAINQHNTVLKNTVYLIIYILLFVLFMLWWDQAYYVVTVLALFPLLIRLFFSFKQRFLYISIIITLITICLISTQFVEDIFNSLSSIFAYISKSTSSQFPNHGISISEQRPLSINKLAELTSANLLIFAIAISGVLFHIKINRQKLLFFIPVLSIGLMSITYAERFLIFLVPFIALGLGTVISLISQYKKGQLFDVLALSVFIFFSVSILLSEQELYSKPIVRSPLVENMTDIQKITPEDAVIWNWCNYGYPLNYWAQRATMCDGSSHDGEHSLYSALPLASSSPQFSANFINFYFTHGENGMRKLLEYFDSDLNKTRHFLNSVFSNGPAEASSIIGTSFTQLRQYISKEDLIVFLYPKLTKNVYLYLDRDTMNVTYWWYWFSTWNNETKSGIHPYYKIFYDINYNDNLLHNINGLKIDIHTGVLSFNGATTKLSSLNIIDGINTTKHHYKDGEGGIVDYSINGKFLVLLNKQTSSTLAHNLYLWNISSKYFVPVKVVNFEFQLWQVRSDRYHDDK